MSTLRVPAGPGHRTRHAGNVFWMNVGVCSCDRHDPKHTTTHPGWFWITKKTNEGLRWKGGCIN